MNSKLPKKIRRIRNVAIVFSLILAYVISFEVGIQRMVGYVTPVQSGINVLSEEAFFSTPEYANYQLIDEKTSKAVEDVAVASEKPKDGLVGDTDAEKIYNFFISKGFTKAGAAGLMGNLSAESGLVSSRLQGDYSEGYKDSWEYVEKVDNGEISKNEFCYSGPNGGGFGLAQWTYHARKAGLYDYAKQKGTSIADLETQLEYILIELEEMPKTFQLLKTTDSLREATRAVLYNYENPRYKNLSARLSLAEKFYY